MNTLSISEDSAEVSADAPAIRERRSVILVVDDSPFDRRLVTGLIDKIDDFAAITARDGVEALSKLDSEPVSIVLTDLQMPSLDGLGLVEHVKLRYPSIPVVLMTACGSEETAMEALKRGAASYVPKKSLARDLVETIRQVLAVSEHKKRRNRLHASIERRIVSVRLENDPDLIDPLIQMFQDDLSSMNLFDENARMRIAMALREALANAIYHGNLEVSSDLRQDAEREFYRLADARRSISPYANRTVEIHSEINREGVVYEIVDQGPGFDIAILNRPIDPEDLMRVGGRGLLLIRTFMDQMIHNESGNRVRLIKRARPREK